LIEICRIIMDGLFAETFVESTDSHTGAGNRSLNIAEWETRMNPLSGTYSEAPPSPTKGAPESGLLWRMAGRPIFYQMNSSHISIFFQQDYKGWNISIHFSDFGS
jgi:hypothetical protein